MFDLQNNYLNEDYPCAGIIKANDVDVKNVYHTILHSMAIQLVLVCNMILNIPFIDYWGDIMRFNQ